MRRLLLALVLVAALVTLTWLALARLGITTGWSHHSTALTIERLQQVSHLTVLRVPVTDIQTTELHGYTGGVRLILQVRGDVDLAVDLTKARLEGIDESARCATLVMPDPVPSRPRVDHERTGIFQITRTGLWQIAPGQAAEERLVSAAMAHAQRTLERAAADPAVIEEAREHASRILAHAAASLGWTLEVR